MPDTATLPRALYRADQVRRLDRIAIETHGIPGIELMTRAGEAAFRLLRERWPDARTITVLAGGGNNAGDGYVVARLAIAEGLDARVLYLADPGRMTGEAALAHGAYQDAGGRCEPFTGLPARPGVIVDALLGTGLGRPVEGPWAEAIAAVNAARAPCLALDIPSGLHADTGAVLGTAVRADATITFIGLKQGLFTGAGPDCRGAVHFSALGVPAVVYSAEILSARRIDWAQQSAGLAPRRRSAHKGDFGHVLVIGGAPGTSGAARLTAEAALRAGAGLVTVATHPSHAAVLNLSRPELMVRGVTEMADLDPLVARADVIAIGPGLGTGSWGRAMLARARTCARPLVLDADALNLLAEAGIEAGAQEGAARDWIITPHPGEAARLLGGGAIAEVEADRFAAVHALCDRYRCVAVLKGAGTLIQALSHRPPALCSDGNPGMATAGSGDLLTGIIAAFLAQGLDAEEAACAGVCLHAAAGDRAALAGEKGMIAGDILDGLRPVLNGLPPGSGSG
jgi:NAD(P)H-hydrate epimerase